jgi:hypothetical protein
VNSWLDGWIKKIMEIDNPGSYREEMQFWTMDMRNYLMSLFEKTVDSTYKFINKKTKEPITTVPLQLVQSLINLF